MVIYKPNITVRVFYRDYTLHTHIIRIYIYIYMLTVYAKDQKLDVV